MEIQYGWKCPQCGKILAPSQAVCLGCSTAKTVYGHNGTVMLGSGTFSVSNWSASLGAFGTCYAGPPVKSVEVQAEEAVGAWRDKGFSVRALITAALDELTEYGDDEEDEDE